MYILLAVAFVALVLLFRSMTRSTTAATPIVVSPADRAVLAAERARVELLAAQIMPPSHKTEGRTDPAWKRVQTEQVLNRSREIAARGAYLGL